MSKVRSYKGRGHVLCSVLTLYCDTVIYSTVNMVAVLAKFLTSVECEIYYWNEPFILEVNRLRSMFKLVHISVNSRFKLLKLYANLMNIIIISRYRGFKGSPVASYPSYVMCVE